jgi:hypothetical protein
VRSRLLVEVPQIGLLHYHDASGAVGGGLRERSVEPAQIGRRALRGLLRLCGGHRLALARVGIVVRAAREIHGDEQGLRLLPHHVLDELHVGGVGRIEALRLRDDLLLATAERHARVREEDRADEREVRDRIAVGVVDEVAGRVDDVAALSPLVTVGPLVVTRVYTSGSSNCGQRSKMDWSYACVQYCLPEWISPTCSTRSTFGRC